MNIRNFFKERMQKSFVKCGAAGCALSVGIAGYEQGIHFSAVFLFCASVSVCFADLLLEKTKDGKRTFLQMALIGAILLGFAAFFYVEFFIVREMYANDDDADARYAIVLGAGIRADQPTQTLRMRLDRAARYLAVRPDRMVVVSGGMGSGEAYTEAEVMKRYLVGRGIAESRILKEDRSTTTDENLKYSKAVILKRGDDARSILIVTSDFHMFRARQIAARYFDEVYGLAADTPPGLRPIYAVRECFAYVKLLVT